MPLKIGYVHEHFSSPLLQFAAVDQGKTFILIKCPGGTGQLIGKLANDEIDIAIALTDALISGIANGSAAFRLVGSFVSTPLNWAVITGRDTKFYNISDLRGTTLGISRPGSGSQVMAHVMALQQDWAAEDLKFQVNNDIHGLIDSVNDGSTSAFMWEWFTTKPWVDKGQARFIGSVPTPWPSWLIAAHSSERRAPSEVIRVFLNDLTKFVRDFDSDANRAGANVEFIKTNFGYPEQDIKEWLKTVAYPEDCSAIGRMVVLDTLSVLEKAKVVKAPERSFSVEQFVNTDVAKVV